MAILISDMIYFKLKLSGRDKDADYMLVKGTTEQEEITLMNINTPELEYFFL